MTKESLLSYVKYNAWANQILCDYWSGQDQDLLEKHIVNSFPSVSKTVVHICFAQCIWLQRLQGLANKFDLKNISESPFKFLCENSNQWIDWMEKQQEENVQSICKFETTKGEAYQDEVWKIVMHCMNHSTYHRGQLTMMTRQLDLIPPLSIDYIHYLRSLDDPSN